MGGNIHLVFRGNIARDPATGRYYVRKVSHGHAVQRSFSTKRGAVVFLEHLELLAAGVELEDDAPTAPTIRAARDSYVERLALLNRAEGTVDYYTARCAGLITTLGNLPLDQVDQARVETYVRARKEKVGAGTVNKELRVLSTLYRHVGLQPRWRLPALSHQPRRRKVYPPERIAPLWLRLPPPVRAVAGLCLLAGLRASEALAATPEWVHGSELWVPVRKTASWNRTWIVPTLAELLVHLPAPPDRDVRRAFERASREAGISPPVSGPGALRHHCASWAVDAGCTRDQVREVLSHQSGTVTDRYIHSQAIAVKRRVLEKVEKALTLALRSAS